VSALVETHGLTAHYGDAQALFGIDFALRAGEVVAIIGANGAGKSTFLKALTGLVKCARDAVRFKGQPIGAVAPGAIVRMGLAMVP
jgi:branched-chain amino acid transport system ATP-binding protein